MSVYMSLRVEADASKLRELAQEKPELFKGVADRAKQRGCIHHTFATANGEVVVMDEWESADAFHSFFEAERENIQPMMEHAEAKGEPQITFYEPLRLGDEF